MAKRNDNDGANITAELSAMLNRVDSGVLANHIRRNRSEDNQIFTVDDLRTTQHYLALLLRGLFVTTHMSSAEFEARWRKFAADNQIAPSKANSDRSNMKHSIQSKKLSYLNFENCLMYLNYAVTNMELTVVDQTTGETHRVSLEDIRALIAKNNTLPQGDDQQE